MSRAPVDEGPTRGDLPSHQVTEGLSTALNRIFLHAMGLGRDDLGRPLAGLAISWDGTGAGGQAPLRAAEALERGLWAGGVTPRKFATIAGGGRSLLARELVADSVELTVRGHSYDAVTGVAADADALAGIIQAGCRLDLPVAVLPLAGPWFGAGDDMAALACVAEVAGLTAPGVAGCSLSIAGLEDGARLAGAHLGQLLDERAGARRLLDRETLRLAASALGAMSAAPDLLVYIAAIAHECGIEAGLEDLLADYVAVGPIWDSPEEALADPLMVRRISGLEPRSGVAGTAWVTGALAGGGAIAVAPETVAAAARVFDEEAEAVRWLRGAAAPEIAGTALVVRGQGPRGGPGLLRLRALERALAETTDAPAMTLTDGRLRAGSEGPLISVISPEAALGGPLAGLRDGDLVRLDGDPGRMQLACEPLREAASPSPLPGPVSRVEAKYRACVGGAPGGAVTHPGGFS